MRWPKTSSAGDLPPYLPWFLYARSAAAILSGSGLVSTSNVAPRTILLVALTAASARPLDSGILGADGSSVAPHLARMS